MNRDLRSSLRVASSGAALIASLLGAPRASSADATPSLALELAPAGDRGFAVERAGVRGHLLVSARVAIDYASRPLVLVNAAQNRDVVVSHQSWLHALVSFALFHRFTLNLELPFVVSQGGDLAPISEVSAPRPGSGGEIGDVRIGARVKLYGSPDDAEVRTDIAFASSAWIPTATEGYAGDGSARVRVALVADGSTKRLYWAFNGGLRTRPAEELPATPPVRVGTALALGLAAGFFADGRRDLAFGTELVADLALSRGTSFLDPRSSVVHLLATGHYRIAGGPFDVGAALGPGFGQGPGSAAYRVLAFVGYAPERAAPPSDRDGDGIPDKSDACVAIPGVASRDRLLHGCPKAARDRDGDGIPDANDACPTAAGEATGVRATHGCPRPADTDGDGVPDATDACPREAGLRPPAGNGCPPPTAALIDQEIVISSQVQFETGTAVLRPESDAVLREVARVLRDHPEIEQIEVQGHTDDIGPPDLNRRLGQERAASVVAWLTGHGIARARLVAKGYGSDEPLTSNTTEEGRARNRRVQFRVLRTKPSAPPAQGGAP